VTVHTTLMGGGFGRRGEYDFSVHAALIAKQYSGIPIKMTWSREEDMTHDFYRPAAMARFRGVVKDGAAQTVDGSIAAPSVTRISGKRLTGQDIPGPDRGHLEGAFDQPYDIPNYRIAGHLTDIHVPIGFWRSVGSSFNGFFLETFIDEMAYAAARDPLDFRLQMAQRAHAPSAKVLEAVAEMSGWTGTKTPGVGRGVAFTFSFGTPVAEVVEVVDENGEIRINKVWIACDVGTALDPSIIEAQMISGAVYGLSAAVQGEITFANGAAQQQNFTDYDALRMHNTPAFEVRILQNNPHIGGVGEPGTPPSMPALGNALFDLTGKRARNLPLNKEFTLIL
jgi:isoquinoline 1-oxidoreductase beta subunit